MRASRSPLRRKSQSPPRKRSGSPPRNRCVYMCLCVSCMIARKRKYIPFVPSAFSCLLLSFTRSRSRSLSLLLFFSLPPSPTQLLALSCPLIFSLSRCLRLSLALALALSRLLAHALCRLSRLLAHALSHSRALSCSPATVRLLTMQARILSRNPPGREAPPLSLLLAHALFLLLSLSLSLSCSFSLSFYISHCTGVLRAREALALPVTGGSAKFHELSSRFHESYHLNITHSKK